MAKNRGSTFEWQMGKSVVECNKYMFEHEIATDVVFEVGPPDGVVGMVRAHKYMLIARSAVFEAMFCSGLAESHASHDTKIPITDVDVGIFREMLR
jgi:BTB/POZ domain